jgi:hypothetical protein
MVPEIDLKEIRRAVAALRENAEKLEKAAGDFPAVWRNAKRILASVRMLEINTSDLFEFEIDD